MADEIKIEHGDAKFTYTCPRHDKVEPDFWDCEDVLVCSTCSQPLTITCSRCGSTEVEYHNGVEVGSSQTGLYGTAEVTCKKCGAEKIVLDP